METLLVFSEQPAVAFELLSKARELGTAVAALLGKGNPEEYFGYGAQKVYVSQAAPLETFSADVYADALSQIVAASGAKMVLIGSTRRGKELAGRLAQKLGCGAVTDAIGMTTQGDKVAVLRYALGGNTVATDVITTECQVISVMPNTFQASPAPVSGQVVQVDLKLREPRVKVVERKPKAVSTANIDKAETLVVVGKGFGKQEDLAIAQAFAKALN